MMKVLHLGCLCLLSLYLPYTKQQNVTGSRRWSHRDTNVLAALQQIQLQLNAMEGESQRQSSNIQELNRIATRLELQRQDLTSTLDKSEARLSQRLEDIKGDVRKVITLQEVIRDDVDKVQQNQLLNKVGLEEKLRQMNLRNKFEDPKSNPDFNTALLGSSSDILAGIQVLHTTMNSLRRMADSLQNSLDVIRNNITHLTNITREILDHQTSAVVSKTYLQSSLQSFQSESQDHQQLIGCTSVIQNHEQEEDLPTDCKEVQDRIQNSSGIYRIQPNYARKPIFVYCDMETEMGGWTVIQRRRDGSVDFLREWNDYKHGFGNVAGEFWLGNENLHLITHQRLYELRVDLQDFEDGHAYAKYGGFAVGSEQEKYMLKLLGPLTEGDAGDGMTYHASLPFSTTDMDNDRWQGGNCARDHTGGWWYNQCDASNLNGQYLGGLTPQEYKGVYWHEWQGPNYSLMSTTMMIRPIRYITTITTITEGDKREDATTEHTITEHTTTEPITTKQYTVPLDFTAEYETF